MAQVRIPTQSFVIIWVSSAYNPAVLQHHSLGKDIFLLLCTPEQLDEVRDEFPRNRVIFSDDHEEAFRLAGEIVEQHQSAERRPRTVSTTVYCFISSAA